MLGATTLYALSWRARHRGHGVRGFALAQLGAGVATAGGFLGGTLAFGDPDPDMGQAADRTDGALPTKLLN